MFVETVLLGLLLPAAIAGVILIVSAVVAGRLQLDPGLRWGAALAVGLAYIIGHFAIARPGWPPVDVTDRIAFLAVLPLVLGLLDAVWPTSAWGRWENRILVSGVTVVALLGPVIGEDWQTQAKLTWLLGIEAAVVLSWANLDALAARTTGARFVLPLAVAVAGASVVVLASGSMILGRLGMLVAAALAGVLLVTLRYRDVDLSKGAVPIVMVVMAYLIVEGHVYAELPAVSAGLLAAAPPMLWVTLLRPIRALGAWKGALIGTVAVGLPVAAALAYVLANAPTSEY